MLDSVEFFLVVSLPCLQAGPCLPAGVTVSPRLQFCIPLITKCIVLLSGPFFKLHCCVGWSFGCDHSQHHACFLKCVCMCVCVLIHVRLCNPMDSTSSSRFLRPWDSPGKNTGVGCHFLLQGIFPTHRWHPSLLHLRHWQVDSFPPHCLGSPSWRRQPFLQPSLSSSVSVP